MSETEVEFEPIQALDYLKLVEKAAGVGFDENWVKESLSKHGMIVDRFDDEVIFTDESWQAIRETRDALLKIEYGRDKKGKPVEKAPPVETEIESPLIAERRRLLSWAKEEQVAPATLETLWQASYLPPPQDPDATKNKLKITAKRLEKFQEFIHGAIADRKDREFAQKYYGVSFPAERLLAPLNLGPRRIAFEHGDRLKPIEIEGIVYEPIIDRAGGRSDDHAGNNGSDQADPAEAKEPELAAVCEPGDAQGSETSPADSTAQPDVSQEIAPTMRYQALCEAWKDKHTKAEIDWLLSDFAEGIELDNDLLDAFEVYLSKGVKASLPAPLPVMTEAERLRYERTLPTMENAERFATNMKRELVALADGLDMISQRIHEGTQQYKEIAQDGFAIIRQVVEPELPRYKETTYKKDGSGEVAHVAGELKSKVFKGFASADICFRKTGGVKLPRQFELDKWAQMQAPGVLEALQEAADQWLETEAPPALKAVARIEIRIKVDKEKVKAHVDDFNFPGVERLPVNETGKCSIGQKGRPFTFTPQVERLKAVLKELIDACSDSDDTSEDEE